jgi:hypothetical protein
MLKETAADWDEQHIKRQPRTNRPATAPGIFQPVQHLKKKFLIAWPQATCLEIDTSTCEIN